jgi:hypothetical protein
MPDQISIWLAEKRKRPKLSLRNGTFVEQPPPTSVHNHPNESGGTWEWHRQATGCAARFLFFMEVLFRGDPEAA